MHFLETLKTLRGYSFVSDIKLIKSYFVIYYFENGKKKNTKISCRAGPVQILELMRNIKSKADGGINVWSIGKEDIVSCPVIGWV